MPLLDHFHPPLHGPRRWEGFHHAWATTLAQQLNLEAVPAGYCAEPEIRLGHRIRIDDSLVESAQASALADRGETAAWSPSPPKIVAQVDFAYPSSYEVRVSEDLGGSLLRAVVVLVSPGNKDREGSRRT